METSKIMIKRTYQFGSGSAEGAADMKPLLGGKGANLAEMSRIGLPVPPGFTVTTDVCTEYQDLGRQRVIDLLKPEVIQGIKYVESIMNSNFGDRENPLLFSVRSGARDSMPGMMDTVLDIGLNDEVVIGLSEKTGKPHFAYDSYRRFIQMYGDVVMKVNDSVEDDKDVFEHIIEQLKAEVGAKSDQELSVENLKELIKRFKAAIIENKGEAFPQDPIEQLWNSIIAVFESWHTPRAIVYRQLNEIPEEWGTAVNIQAMVYGNMGEHSASGVAFTRDASTGENCFNGEYLIDAQGEDVVSGIRTPHQVTLTGSRRWAKLAQVSEEERARTYVSLEEYMPQVFKELVEIEHILEGHFQDMQDLEFTIQENKLWILQTRNGKRTGPAMVRIALEMLDEGKIDERTLLKRMDPNKVGELLHPVFDNVELAKVQPITKGLPASPGAATGQIVFFADDALQWKKAGKEVILVRIETSPEDLAGMDAAVGILTAHGGMTSHAAVVARGMGKCCIAGAGSLQIEANSQRVTVNGKVYKEGDWISIDGGTGYVYEGKVKTTNPELTGNLGRLIEIADKYAKLDVHANADTPEAARVARSFGAEGIGLCRTEHMFFEIDRIAAMREMIMAENEAGRKNALRKLLPMQRSDFQEMLETMEGYPVTIRLLDPPLHEFLPKDQASQNEMARVLGVTYQDILDTIESLREQNPMLGHRGCRLGNTYPEITEMQARAIIEATLNLKSKGIISLPEIMIPLIGSVHELRLQIQIVRSEIEKVFEERQQKCDYKIGTMIEVPRAALRADHIAPLVEFFSFGTNDLTQMTFGYSRDDVAKFLPIYLEKGLLKHDPFAVLDQEGVGQLVQMAVEKGRSANKELTIGICGEHGGEPSSIQFCHKVGMDYVSCSPFRVPIAKVATAKAAIGD